jgi:hypothetical protein
MMGARTLEYIAGKSPRYEVIGGAAVVRTTAGRRQYLERGMWVPSDTTQMSIEHLLSEGLIRVVGSAS